MSNAGKALFSLFLVITMLTFIVYKADVVVFDTKKDVYVSAIRAASQVATKEIIDVTDVNFIYDGNRREASDISVNLGALDTFRNTLTRILDSKKDGSLVGVTNINVPLTGFVTYKYIIGVTYDDTYLLPMGYTYTMTDSTIPADLRDKIWNFTLGDKIYIDNKEYTANGTVLTESITKNDYDIKGFLNKYNFKEMKQFSQYIVMDCIDNYLNEYSGASFNPIVDNTQSQTRFELGKSNYSSNRGEYTKKSSLIEGPGLFAIVDVYTGSGNEQKLYQRIASFGGSELVQSK